MLKFYVISANREMVNDTDRSTRSRALPLQWKVLKKKVFAKTLVSPNNRLILSA